MSEELKPATSTRRNLLPGRENPSLIVYGAKCTWWDDIRNSGTLGGETNLPCCPYCRGVLFQMDAVAWWKNVDCRDKDNPAYRKTVEWARGKCFPIWPDLVKAYEAQEHFDPPLHVAPSRSDEIHEVLVGVKVYIQDLEELVQDQAREMKRLRADIKALTPPDEPV